jgi:hypothetical protein
MPIYVARVERDGKVLLERADVTVELLEGSWRGRFLLPPGSKLPRGAKVSVHFADGREGKATVSQVHPASSKHAPRLVELSGKGELG